MAKKAKCADKEILNIVNDGDVVTMKTAPSMVEEKVVNAPLSKKEKRKKRAEERFEKEKKEMMEDVANFNATNEAVQASAAAEMEMHQKGLMAEKEAKKAEKAAKRAERERKAEEKFQKKLKKEMEEIANFNKEYNRLMSEIEGEM